MDTHSKGIHHPQRHDPIQSLTLENGSRLLPRRSIYLPSLDTGTDESTTTRIRLESSDSRTPIINLGLSRVSFQIRSRPPLSAQGGILLARLPLRVFGAHVPVVHSGL